MFDLCIRGGTIVTDAGSYRGDIFIDAGKIAAITAPGSGDAGAMSGFSAARVIDADNRHILPGMIDSHAHFRTWSEHCDSFDDLMESAALGGLSSVLGFIAGASAGVGDLNYRVEQMLAQATAGGAPIDYSFHVILTDEEHDPISQLESVAEQGIHSAKLFMTYADRGLMVSDDFMFRAMSELQRIGGLAMVHAELDGPISTIERRLRSTGELNAATFNDSRPSWLEAEGARRAAEYALRTECPLYVVHVSCEEGIDALVDARARGAQVYIETCPQYLNLDSSATVEQQAKAKVAPPLRSDRDRQAITDAVLEGIVDVVASDHSPKTKDLTDRSDDYFARAPVGAPGTQTLLLMTWRALAENGCSLSDLVRLTSSQPAAIFGLDDRKGAIEVGRDADLTIVDTQATTRVDAAKQRSQTGYTLYDGVEIPLRIETTISRGNLVLSEERLSPERTGSGLSQSWVWLCRVGERVQ